MSKSKDKLDHRDSVVNFDALSKQKTTIGSRGLLFVQTENLLYSIDDRPTCSDKRKVLVTQTPFDFREKYGRTLRSFISSL